MVERVDRSFGCYEIVDGEPHFREEQFINYLRRKRIQWPRLKSGALDLKARTFRDMARSYTELAPLHELRNVLAQLRSNKLSIGNDGRNRCLLGPFGTKTGRNAPSNSKFIFGPSKCLRFLIMPNDGMALVYRDFSQEEVRIAAIKAHDMELRRCVRLETSTTTLRGSWVIRRTGTCSKPSCSASSTAEILARLRARFRTFEYYCDAVRDHAGLDMIISTNFGWTLRCPPGTPKRTLRNWPIQAAAAEIMHVFCILAERRGLPVITSVHDAFMAEGAAADIVDISRELDRAMGDASEIVLHGYRLPTDDGGGPILPGQRFYDKHGEAMWNRINNLIDNLQRRRA